ncbi:nitroreductase family protein [Polymorphobacter sp.]|uniref:nitroreductase family protein n=1 Tax=Polymorphobacter sp. TaxID=1909290 RepID=UPI003F723813
MIFNDTATAASLLATRRSGKARDLVAPGPDAPTLAAILAAAIRVPDHGKLAPWRFIVIGADQREALGAMLENAYRAEKPGASRMEIEAMHSFARQAPTLIVLMSRPYPESHIPLWEQQLSVGAAGMQLLNAAHAHGFVGNWLTGWASFSPAVTAALGEPGERIAGFFFIGTATKPLDERPRPEPAAVIRLWAPPTG